MRSMTWIVAVMCLWCLGAARAAEGIELAGPYVDLTHGFSICPPAGTDRNSEGTASQLVSWTKRDAKTTAVAWTFAVGKITDPRYTGDMKAYSQGLADTLRDKEHFKIDRVEVRKVAGRDGFDIKGQTEGKVLWWQRQVWVQADKTAFLIFRITGPPEAAKDMDATLSAVLGTLKVIDPAQARVVRQKNLQAGSELLKALTDSKLRDAVLKEPKWYLLRRGGKDVGYVFVSESMGAGGRSELSVRIVAGTGGAGGGSRTVLTATTVADGTAEQWQQRDSQGTSSSPQLVQTVSQKDGNVSCRIERGGRSRTFQNKVPQGIYMPEAMINILPRLVNLDKPGTCSFARYVAARNAFDVYTLQVVGREEIQLGDKKVRAVRLELQTGESAPKDALWVDDHGSVLRFQGGDGSVMEPAGREDVIKKYPGAAQAQKD